MRKVTHLMAAIGLASAPVLLAAPAQAVTLAHTWVAAAPLGSDFNNCDRPTPCASFAAALASTTAGGEITCVDSGNFGSLTLLTISKSITINCEAAIGSTTLPGGNSMLLITVNTAQADVVVLRGLDLDGLSTPIGGGVAGLINFIGAGTLHVQKVKINNLHGSGGGFGNGILFKPSGPAKLFVSDSTITDNGSNGLTGGIVINPNQGIPADVSIERCQINNNFYGIVADAVSGVVIHGVVSDSTVAGNANIGILAATTPGGGGSTVLLVESTKVAGNAYGLAAIGPGAVMAVGKSSIMLNGTGLFTSGGGAIGSFKNNNLGVNGTDGAFSAVAAQQ